MVICCKELSVEELFKELNKYVRFAVELIYSGISVQIEDVIGIDFQHGDIIFANGEISINNFQKAFMEDDGMYWIDITDNYSIQIICWE